jgi:hypothetical protein
MAGREGAHCATGQLWNRLGLQLTPHLGLAGTSTRPPPASCDGTIRLGTTTGRPPRNGDRPPSRLAWTLARNVQLLAVVLGRAISSPLINPTSTARSSASCSMVPCTLCRRSDRLHPQASAWHRTTSYRTRHHALATSWPPARSQRKISPTNIASRRYPPPLGCTSPGHLSPAPHCSAAAFPIP